jgi:hypothetical protein
MSIVREFQEKQQESMRWLKMNHPMVFVGPEETRGDIFKFDAIPIQRALLDDRIARSILDIQNTVIAANQDQIYQAFIVRLEYNPKEEFREYTAKCALDKTDNDPRKLHHNLRYVAREIHNRFPLTIIRKCQVLLKENKDSYQLEIGFDISEA